MAHWKSELFCTAFNKGQLPPAVLPEIVFVGRSNVGKSTLVNALLGKRIARVSSTPGKTRSINFYNIDDGERKFSLVDLPGYGYAARGMGERRSWWKFIEEYFGSGRKISYIVHLIDFRHGPLINDNELITWLDKMDMPRLVVFTKGDKVSPGRRKGQYNILMRGGLDSVLPPFITSGVNDAEMEKLRGGIADILCEMERLDALEAKRGK